MPARYKILKSVNLKHVVIEGSTNYEELERLFLDYLRDPAFAPDLRILADLRGMTDALAGLWEIRKLKALYQFAYHDAVGVVDVVIVTGRGMAFRAARAFQLIMHDKKPLVIRITDSMAAAQSMLNLSNNVLAQLDRGGQSSKVVSFPIH
ncbi:hypothetical protein [Rhodobacter ferrooxidans]|uniref:Uncharacterized protein n=1 Tax=Rhodobacter ferrooxidans TaxID=371731 RepID=C8S5L5_9RHOB|nr:hypothetical protein [Rhodobacter sp. SW2]EEW23717.1 hypothetical protein Rsw2DRAFT_3344 [Rhodobacter sp. SW2]